TANVGVAGGRDVDGAGNMGDRIFLREAHIEHRRRASSKDLLEPCGRDLGSGLAGFEQAGLEDVWGCRTLRLKRQQNHAAGEDDKDSDQGVAHNFLLSTSWREWRAMTMFAG